MSRLELIVAKDLADLAKAGAEILARKIEHAVRARSRCAIGLAGGLTPRPVYEALGNGEISETLPWSQMDFYFGDERAVPIDHPQSNYQMARQSLFRTHPDALGRVYRMPAEAPNREEASERYSRRLPDPLDILLLGMGMDGHTASLFPGSPALEERERRVVPVEAPRPPRDRLTITPPVIESARSVVVIVSGVDKAHMLSRALSGPHNPREIPAQLARHGTWIVDKPAAMRLLSL